MGELGSLPKAYVIRFRGEADESLIVDIDTPGIHGGDAHVEPQIELEAVDEERVGYVPRYNAVFVDGDLRDVVDLAQKEERG